MKFDRNFYPSITKKLLDKALGFANNYKTVPTQKKKL